MFLGSWEAPKRCNNEMIRSIGLRPRAAFPPRVKEGSRRFCPAATQLRFSISGLNSLIRSMPRLVLAP